MEKSNLNKGRWIAVILIIAFFGINFYKTDKNGGPQEVAFKKAKAEKNQAQALAKKIAPSQNIDKLKYAYTGNWEKNVIQHAEGGTSDFTLPENQRNMIEATAAKKKDKKKKKVAKKKKTKKMIARKSKGKSRFDWDPSDSNSGSPYVAQNNYYYSNQQENRTPNEEKEKEKELTLTEWLELIKRTNSISELVSKFSSGKVTSSTFYAVVSTLLSSEQDSDKKLGFLALQKFPSAVSFELYAIHINDNMSAETRTVAQNTSKAYHNPNHLRFLNTALNNPKAEVKTQAALLIRDITTSILAAVSNTGENVVYSPQHIEEFKRILGQSLLVINGSIDSTEGEVRASFASAQNILVQFLS